MPKAKGTPVGTVWVFPADDPVEIVRPDGATVRVVPSGGQAAHVLDVAGPYQCGDLTVTAG